MESEVPSSAPTLHRFPNRLDPLSVTALFLILAGLMHIPIYLWSGQSWEGPLSFRKPILFGVSTGLTVASIAWVLPRLRRRPLDPFVGWVFSIAMTIEVGLITTQTWRGVPSHFNNATPLDHSIDGAMWMMISVATILIVYIAARSFIFLNASPDVRLGINAGFCFLILSCAIGYVISYHGHQQMIAGENPSIYGNAGVTKFPHGVAIHAIQIFPLISWLLKALRIPLVWRNRAVWAAILLMAMMLIFSIIQTLQGKSRFDVSIFY